MLLIQRSVEESPNDLLASIQAQYDIRADDTIFGPMYDIGPTYSYRDKKFTQIQTFAGSLMMRIASDVRQGKFKRSVLFRHNAEASFTFLSLGDGETQVKEVELTPCV